MPFEVHGLLKHFWTNTILCYGFLRLCGWCVGIWSEGGFRNEESFGELTFCVFAHTRHAHFEKCWIRQRVFAVEKIRKKQTLHVWRKPSLILWGFDVVATRLKPQSQLLTNFAEAMSWKELHPTGTAPSARCELSAIYDPPSHSMVFFGGESLPLNLLTLTWVLFWAVLRVSFLTSRLLDKGHSGTISSGLGRDPSLMSIKFLQVDFSCHAFLRWCVGIGFEGQKTENWEQTVSGDLRLYPDMTDILRLVKWT